MKVLGHPNFFHYLEVFFIERYKSIKEYANGTLEKFNYERFSLLGEFIIGAMYGQYDLALTTISQHLSSATS